MTVEFIIFLKTLGCQPISRLSPNADMIHKIDPLAADMRMLTIFVVAGRLYTPHKKDDCTMINENRINVPVMTVSEAARFIGVGKKVIYQLLEFDEIRAVRERGKVWIDRSSLEAFHKSGKRP